MVSPPPIPISWLTNIVVSRVASSRFDASRKLYDCQTKKVNIVRLGRGGRVMPSVNVVPLTPTPKQITRKSNTKSTDGCMTYVTLKQRTDTMCCLTMMIIISVFWGMLVCIASLQYWVLRLLLLLLGIVCCVQWCKGTTKTTTTTTTLQQYWQP